MMIINKRRKGKVTSFLLFYLFTFLPLQAQDSLLLRNYQFVKQADPWLTHRNAAALTRFANKNIAEAEVSLTKGNGGLVNFNESDDLLQADVRVESFYRISPRTVAFGSISYNNWSGDNMTGSAFIPTTALRPFDIVEDSLANAGRKHRDTYQLTGGVGVDICQGLAFGARIDYTAANYAKYKDLRHQNKLMDLTASASVYAPVTSWLRLGAGYSYHRQTESLTFGTYGKSEKVYKSLIDYGGMMGLVEQFGNSGFTDKSHEMPLFEDGHGGSFQLEWLSLPQFSAYATIGFCHATGYYGRVSPYTITPTNHDRDCLEAAARLTYTPSCTSTSSCMSRFYLDLSYTKEKLQNSAETYRELTNDAGAIYYEYYDPAETADKQQQRFTVAATAHLGIQGELPTWTITAAGQWWERQQTAYLFPYYRYQQLRNHQFSLSGTRHIVCRKGVWSASLHAAWQEGSGDLFRDGTFVTPSDKQPLPATMEAFLHREYRYLTVPQYTFGGSVKYAFLLPSIAVKPHVSLSVNHRQAGSASTEQERFSMGDSHTQVTLAIGCGF